MEQLARSPDLNPIENLWGVMVRDVYRDRRHFSNVAELTTAVHVAWDKLSQDLSKRVFSSTSNRCISVRQRDGADTNY